MLCSRSCLGGQWSILLCISPDLVSEVRIPRLITEKGSQLTSIVTEDLVRYMESALSLSNPFLIDDPSWAIDFAPNGKWNENDALMRIDYP